MIRSPVATFVASDATIEDALPFLDAFRRSNPDLPLLLIPRDARVATLSAFGVVHNFDILQRKFDEIDLLEEICFGHDRSTRGCLRLLAGFDLAVAAWIHIDTAARVGGLAGLAARLSAQASPVFAAPDAVEPVYAATAVLPPVLTESRPFATTWLAAGGPPLGSARVIRTLRENLVTYMRGRAGADWAASVLNVGLGCLGVPRVATDDVLAATPRAASAVEVVPLRSCHAEVTALNNGGSYRRSHGRVIGAPVWLAEARAEETRKNMVNPPAALVGRLRYATVYDRGVVVTGDGRVVAESLINAESDTTLDGLRDRPRGLRDLDGPLVLLKQTWDNNYGHWLIESLPRIGLVAECHDLATCRFLIAGDGGAIGRVYRDSLALLGIEAAQIVASDDTRFCADLIYPAPLTAQPWVKAPRVIRFLEALGERVARDAPGPRRVYVSRNETGRRVLRNEATILDGLAALGYVVVSPERLDFAGQVRMFRDATHVIGNLGAGLANLAFAPRGVRLLALTTEFMQDDFFWDLVSQRGGHYVSLHGRASNPDAGMNSDFDVDPALFWPLLAAFHAQGGTA